MTVRSFSPQAVKREHIKPITIVYGNDKPGIALRTRRFAQILEESGERPNCFSNASDAISYITCGDIFSDTVCCVIDDVSDMLGSSTESKNLYKAFTTALASYGAGEMTVVMGAFIDKPTQAANQFLNDMNASGALIRQVNVPNRNELAVWLSEYAKSTGSTLSMSAAQKIADAAECDADLMKTMYYCVGDEAETLSPDEIREWLETDGEVQPSALRQYVIAGDVSALDAARRKYERNTNGYRTFMLKLRLSVFDLLVAALSNGDERPLASLKASKYGKASGIYYYMRDADFPDSARKLLDVYDAIEREITFIGSGSGQSSYNKVLLAVANINKQSDEYVRNRKLKSYAELAPLSPKKIDSAMQRLAGTAE